MSDIHWTPKPSQEGSIWHELKHSAISPGSDTAASPLKPTSSPLRQLIELFAATKLKKKKKKKTVIADAKNNNNNSKKEGGSNGGKAAETTPAAAAIDAVTRAIDARRLRNASIVLKSMKLEVSNIIAAISQVDVERLPGDSADRINHIFPTQAEIDLIRKEIGFVASRMALLSTAKASKPGKDPSPREKAQEVLKAALATGKQQLQDNIHFYLGAAAEGGDICGKFESVLFQRDFLPRMKALIEPLTTMERAICALKSSYTVKKVLKKVLQFGNFMNVNSGANETHGFDLSALCMLSRIKSRDNRISLLGFIALQVRKDISRRNRRKAKMASILSMSGGNDEKNGAGGSVSITPKASSSSVSEALKKELESLHEAARIDENAIRAEIKVMQKKMNSTSRLLASSTSPPSSDLSKLSRFIEEAATHWSKLLAQVESIETLHKTLCKYLGHNESSTWGSVFQIWQSFLGDLSKAEKAAVKISRNDVLGKISSAPKDAKNCLDGGSRRALTIKSPSR
eukprot:jgi/Bigna1/134662/aug1.26_g9370